MIYETIDVRGEGSLSNVRLQTYILETYPEFYIKERPLVIICPGGGYEHLSNREAEGLAVMFNSWGYHAAVLYYSIAPAVYPAAFLELGRAVKYLREHAEQYHIMKDGIYVMGSSAGGHLAAGYGCFWKKDFVTEGVLGAAVAGKDGAADGDMAAGSVDGDYREILRPNGMLLNYPVITSGEYAHRGSFVNLLGNRYEELVDEMSLEYRVNEDTPAAFIWHTYTDGAVPVENSLLFISALRKQGISVEFHMYPEGAHGLSLASTLTRSANGTEVQPAVQSWTGLLHTYLQGKCGF